MKRKILICLLVLGLGVGTATAQLGSGIVYDPTNYGKMIEQAETGLKQLQQLQSQVQQAQRLYDGFNQASGVNSLATLLESPQLRAVLPDAATFITYFLRVPGRDVARYEIPETRISILQVIVALSFGNIFGSPRIALLFRYPHASIVPERL